MVRHGLKFWLLLLIGLLLLPLAALAQSPADEAGLVYTVQADDWLSKLADKFYGDPLAYLVIFEATNSRAAQDESFAFLTDPNLIEVGQKLFIPQTGEISAELVSNAEAMPLQPAADSVTMAGPSPEQVALLASMPSRGTPPELFNEVWLNSEPLKLAELRGKVVLIEFWTYGCINCKNTLSSLRAWHQEYADDGLVIIGVHTPEFSFEREIDNVKAALVSLDVPYAVAIDNDWTTWRSFKKPFGQRYWPTHYYVDKAGNVRHIHIGEGRYEQQKEIIKALLAEKEPGI